MSCPRKTDLFRKKRTKGRTSKQYGPQHWASGCCVEGKRVGRGWTSIHLRGSPQLSSPSPWSYSFLTLEKAPASANPQQGLWKPHCLFALRSLSHGPPLPRVSFLGNEASELHPGAPTSPLPQPPFTSSLSCFIETPSFPFQG